MLSATAWTTLDPEEQPPNLIAGAYGYAIRAWDIDGGTILLGLGAELYNYPNKTVPLLEMLGVGEAHTQLQYYLTNQTDTDDTIRANWLKNCIIPKFAKATEGFEPTKRGRNN